MKTENVHIYHIKATKDGKEECCHYTGTTGMLDCVRRYLLSGWTVETYMEV